MTKTGHTRGGRAEHGDGIPAFLAALRAAGFAGDIADDAASRIVYASDNSIYQVPPKAVVFPKTGDDLHHVVRQASRSPEGPVAIAPRGGGTGTNGQSLTSGVVVDLSRHLNRILSLDVNRREVLVEPGVVLDQLNAHLAPHGLFFPPTVSTASRATIGGMVATDASGKGSRIYGKTSDYVLTMDVVLADGTGLTIAPLTRDEMENRAVGSTLAAGVHREVLRIIDEHRALIDATFPKMNRGLTGYNLQHLLGEDGLYRLSYLLAGSEGTLALTKSIRLRLLPRPTCRALVAIRYHGFAEALADVQRLLQAEPAAIEILDDIILGLAQQDIVWPAIQSVLGGTTEGKVGGLNFVEFVGAAPDEVETGLDRIAALLSAGAPGQIDWKIVRDVPTIAQLWSLREKSVGLLGRLGQGTPGAEGRQGIAFVEDTAVPPAQLAAYVAEFRALLDGHGLSYGMFGHADVGCLHVRPALNLREPGDAALIRPISDAVAALTLKYGGLLWGEHGRGYRGEFSPAFFGPVLYDELCALKRAFDPQNIFNPGKLASPDLKSQPVDRIDAVALRGEADRTIPTELARTYDRAIACNGNGACFTWDLADPMCPSYKATRDRNQSPKGRAALLREWARLQGVEGPGVRDSTRAAIEAGLKQSLDSCLSCRACTSQCPVKVDIPAMKSAFYADYYQRHRRPFRHHLAAMFEHGLPLGRALPWLGNLALRLLGLPLLANRVGLVDLPSLRPAGRARHVADPVRLAGLPAEAKRHSVIVVEDSFTSSFDGAVVDDVEALLQRLGLDVYRAPPRPNGKALDVLGFQARFSRVAKAARKRHEALLATGIPVVGIDPVPLILHDEGGSLPSTSGRVQSLDAFLVEALTAGTIHAPRAAADHGPFQLLLHCMEKTARPTTANRWDSVFQAFGLPLEHPKTGCCGMAGLFGHEVENEPLSRRIFSQSWGPTLECVGAGRVLATGFSCRCQAGRYAGMTPLHPAQALLQAVTVGSERRST